MSSEHGRFRELDGLSNIAIDVILVDIVVATEVVLHPIPPIHKKVIVCVVVRAAIIVVNILLRAVVVDEEVVVNLT